ncbi:MAG: glycosyltransferase [Firmicutes bacterium]|nr:glycosyltransferase [Bacillota bacterium]
MNNLDYKKGKNGLLECPCCGNFTIEGSWEDGTPIEVIVDICSVCFWQFDLASQENINISIGPNRVSLIQAKENYKTFGADEKMHLEYVRPPLPEELPENN